VSPVGGPHSTGKIEGAAAEKTAREKKAQIRLWWGGGGWGSAWGAGRAEADSAGAAAATKKNTQMFQQHSGFHHKPELGSRDARGAMIN
jgi:hypothetical protein